MPDLSLNAFFEYLKGVKSKNTALKYRTYTRSFLQLMEKNGYTDFSQIPPGLLNEFASMLTQQGKGPATVHLQVYAVKKYLDWVRGRGVDVPIQSKPDLPRKSVKVRPTLPPRLFSEFFREADRVLEEPVRTAVMLLPCSGLRASEMVRLRLVHIQRARVKLQGEDKKGNPRYKTTLFLKVHGKGDKERHVPLMDEGVEILTGYLTGWRRRKPGVWLFPHPGGGRKQHMTDRMLRDGVRAIRPGLNMEFTPHTMRRTYITTLWRRKIDLGTIARIAGHANVQTTINHYLAMDPSDAINALHNAGSSLTEEP